MTEYSSDPKDKLHIIWTSADREIALKMVFMYAYNAKKKGWWSEVALTVWGPSAKLLSYDEELKRKISDMSSIGVELFACKACADMYGVSEVLEELGISVIYMGEPLTRWLKSDYKIITF